RRVIRFDNGDVGLSSKIDGRRTLDVALLDRHPREAGPLLPDDLVGLALRLRDLAPAAGEDEHVRALLLEARAALAAADDDAEALQELPPAGDLEVELIAEAPHVDAALLGYLREHVRYVEHAEERVIADEEARAHGIDVLAR